MITTPAHLQSKSLSIKCQKLVARYRPAALVKQVVNAAASSWFPTDNVKIGWLRPCFPLILMSPFKR